MEIVTAIAEKIAEPIVNYTVAPIARQVGYLIFYRDNFKNLEDQVAGLKGLRDTISHEVEAEIRNGRQIYDIVQNWLERVDEIVEAAEQLGDDPRHRNAGCCKGPFPNLKSRHQLSRKAKKMAANVAQVMQGKDNIGSLSFLPDLEAVGSTSATSSEKLESRKKIKEDIVMALRDPNLSRIGVYGLGGVGKTFLVKEIAKQVKDDKLFDVVVMANVTQNADLERIQGAIADFLGLRFEEMSIVRRASRLKQRIQNEENILVVLDDIWDTLELDKLGIPLNDHKGCKLLLTSRNLDILRSMETQKDFLIDILNEEEAWILFEDMVGDVVKNVSLRDVAIQVAQNCGGLIVLIVMVARALKDKSDIDSWKDALNQLKIVDKEGMSEKIYSALEFSYNHLEGDEVKTLFLLCGLLGPQITVEDLLKYAIGLGIFKQIYTTKDARLKLHRLISSLKASCLLLENNSIKEVKMHDIVHEVAVSIASRDQHVCKIGLGDELWPSKEFLQRCTQIMLAWCHISKLPERLECPNIKLFCLNNINESLSVPDSFFEGMKNLKVLDLTYMHLPSLPQSFHSLIGLQTLCLDQCPLGDITNIGALTNLQILSLRGSSMITLPSELGQLTHLKMLDLTESGIEIFPSNIISKLTKLEELYLGNTSIKWNHEDSIEENKNASLKELKYLTNLTALEIQIKGVWVLPKDIMFDKLERYKMVVGDVWEWSDNYGASKILKLKLNSAIHLEHGIKELIEGVEDLYLDEVNGISNMLYDLNGEGFPLLKHFQIQNNWEIQHIINSMERKHVHVLFPKLETLILENLNKLEKICHGSFRNDSFAKLRSVKVKCCDQLKHLFSLSMVKALCQLVEIEVSECSFMKNIVLLDSGTTVNVIDSIGSFDNKDAVLLGELLPELRQLCLRNLDSFTGILSLNNHWRILNFKMLNHLTVCGCIQLKYLLPLHVLKDLQQLKNIDISDCEQLEQVFVDEQGTQTTKSNVMEELPFLRSLELSNLPQLASICSGAGRVIARSLMQMTVENCPKFIFTFAYGLRSIEEQEPSKMIITPSKLANLNLSKVDHLKNMCKDPLVSFTHLTSLRLENCNKVEYLFSLSMARELSSLQELRIVLCERIEQIVKRETEETSANTVVFRKVETLILDQLPKLTGSSQDGTTTKWLALNTIQVVKCPKIQNSMLGTVDRPLLKTVTVANCTPWECEDLESNIAYLFNLTDKLSKIENLKIEDSKQLKKYMEMKLQGSSFTQLKTVEALLCDKELNNLFSILLDRSYKLERLKVERCELLEQVFDLTDYQEQRNLKFPNLNTLQLLCLPKLNCIWNKDPRGIVELGKLVKLEIVECGLRKSPLSTALVETLVLLEELKIESCKMIEQVVEDDLEMQERSFLNLKDLQLASLPNLIKFNSGNCNFRFPNLLRLRIEKCPKLNAFTTGFLSNQTLAIERTSSDHVPLNEMIHACPKLQTLKLAAGLEMLEDIWQGEYYRIPLWDLKAVEVDSLSGLRHMRIARSEKLETLVVRNCTSLERLVLPSKCFNLRKVEISDCNILQEIFTDLEHEKTDNRTFHHLESFVLENMPELSFFSFLETCEFPSLRKLRIVKCPMLVTSPRNYKHSAFVLFDDIMEDSPSGEGKTKIPPQLELLELANLPNMQLWKQEPDIPVFQNLTLLKIISCRRIEQLFSIPVAEHLSVLKLLTLYGCENMVQVLQGGGGGNSKPVFQKLETLVLKHLPRLTSFSEEDVDFGEFPELKMVRVEHVPRMEIFVKKPLSTPKLKQVHVTYITKCWNEDLNNTITYLHKIHDMLKEEVWESDQSSTSNRPRIDIFSSGKTDTPMLQKVRTQEEDGKEHRQGDLNTTVNKIFQDMAEQIVDTTKQEILELPSSSDGREQKEDASSTDAASRTQEIYKTIQTDQVTESLASAQNPEESHDASIGTQEMCNVIKKPSISAAQNVPLPNSTVIPDAAAMHPSSSQAPKLATAQNTEEPHDSYIKTHEMCDTIKKPSGPIAQNVPNSTMIPDAATIDPSPSKVLEPMTSSTLELELNGNYNWLNDISPQNLPYLEVGLKRHPQVLDWFNTKQRGVFATLFTKVTRILRTTRRRNLTDDDRDYIRECCAALEAVGFDASWLNYVYGCIESCCDGDELKRKIDDTEAKASTLRNELASDEASLISLRDEVNRLDNFIES